jgi:UDP-N-acetylmuramoyl-L-alanyl-D-glutamate--2,6-diaminopimelate ligase
MLLSSLVEAVFAGPPLARRSDAGADVRICDVTEDSRTAVPGSLFIARPGARTDGRRFIADAVERGAVAVLTDDDTAAGLPVETRDRVAVLVSPDVPLAGAVLAEAFWGRPSSKLFLVGVTGTNGKTTVAHAVHHLLNAAGIRCGLVGTVEVDDGTGVRPAELTTPPATELSCTFDRMLDAGCSAAVIEASSHALTQSRVDALDFDAAIFTNLSGDHLDYHGTMEAYAAAKSRLFTLVRSDGLTIANVDDAWCDAVTGGGRAAVLRCRPTAPERAEPGDAFVRLLGTPTLAGANAEYVGPWGSFSASTTAVGAHNLANVLFAACAAHRAGAPVEALKRGVASFRLPAGRLERVGSSPAVFVDYAHTDAALASALAAVKPLVPRGGALRVVFGCGGDRDRSKRPRMAAAALAHAGPGAGCVIVTSDNPRTESPSAIIDDVLTGVPSDRRGEVVVHADRRSAIRAAIADAGDDDVVVIAGKGHETYQLLPDPSGAGGGVRRIDFDDRAVAREALDDRHGVPTGERVARDRHVEPKAGLA